MPEPEHSRDHLNRACEQDGHSEQVDRALTDWGMAMGMFAVDDMAGRDVGWRVREEMKRVLSDIRDGTHAKKWIAEYRKGAPNLYAQRAKEQEQPLGFTLARAAEDAVRYEPDARA